MLARVARWEGADAATLERSVTQIREENEAEGGPPPGVPAKRLLLLHDTGAGKAVAIAFFENEEDYHQGDETLNSMTPPGGGMGERVAVERYEVALEIEA